MLKVALRGLFGRKLRTVLTAIAIVLGVAMVTGTYILTDSIKGAFNGIFTEIYSGTDATVTCLSCSGAGVVATVRLPSPMVSLELRQDTLAPLPIAGPS